jgi:hypothetical protein
MPAVGGHQQMRIAGPPEDVLLNDLHFIGAHGGDDRHVPINSIRENDQFAGPGRHVTAIAKLQQPALRI